MAIVGGGVIEGVRTGSTSVAGGVERLVELFRGARRPVILTGAGVSTESGIPDFRSPGGLWDRFDPAALTYQSFMAGRDGRRRYWAMGRVVYPIIRGATPGPAHRAVAALARLGRLDCCITQNVDGLHQRAGLPPAALIELHGNAASTRCLDCGAAYSRDEVHAWLEAGAEVADCPACGGVVKPWTVLFGEPLPAGAAREAERRARAADLFVVVGSSLAVYPAAYLPVHARAAGARVAVVDVAATARDHHADLVVRGTAGEVLTAVVADLERDSA